MSRVALAFFWVLFFQGFTAHADVPMPVGPSGSENTAPAETSDTLELPVMEGDSSGSSQHGYVIGRDDRRLLTSNAFPWSAVGRVDTDTGICTGTLIGPDLAVTNTHCVLDESGNLSKHIVFSPNYKYGKGYYTSLVNWVWYGKPSSPQDYAILRLNSPLGRYYGWMNVRDVEYDTLMSTRWHGALSTAGYSGDKYLETPDYQIGCSTVGFEDGAGLLHDCDTYSGASGSPLFVMLNRTPTIVALNWGHRSQGDANYGVMTGVFVQTVDQRLHDEAGKATGTLPLQLCNRSRYSKIWVATAGYEAANGNYTVRGWWGIDQGTCFERLFPNTASSADMFVYATADNNVVYGGHDGTMCVYPGQAFSWVQGTTCGGKAVGVSRIRVTRGQLNTYNFN